MGVVARERLDRLLVERGLAESRERAQALILAGAVQVTGEVARRAAMPVPTDATIVVSSGSPYVSRGGFKLAHALDRFEIEVKDQILADVGASTGGFTDCLLRRGALRVYAIDVGRGQLDWRLRNDERVVVLERTNARYVEQLPEQMDGTVIDVSFISLRMILPPVLSWQRAGAWTVALVKPQFEAGRENVERGGVVRDAEVHRRVLEDVVNAVESLGAAATGITASPIRGPAGNVEFLLHIRRGHPSTVGDPEITAALAEAPLAGSGVRAS